jgi:hypothetical protein
MPKKKRPVRGSSDTPSEEYLNAKWERANIRMPKELGLVKRLRALADRRGESLWEWVKRHVEIDERK